MATIPTPEITRLLTRYRAGETLTEAETTKLAEWLHVVDAVAFDGVADNVVSLENITETAAASLEAKLDALAEEQGTGQTPVRTIHRIHFIRRFKWIAAAVILFVIAGGAWFWFTQKNTETSKEQVVASIYKNDVAPGKKGGKLRLSDSTLLTIDSLKEGYITTDAGMQLFKENGRIVYKGVATAVAYNEIIEETGRYTMAELPDHSKAWVASNSSIRYPLQFAANERKVTMTGQAAFEVIHNEKQPFRVQVEDQVYEDMGTVFNIRAYTDEQVIKTTVMEGSVAIGGNMIRKSQQSQTGKDGKVRIVNNVNVESVFAWRDGEFTFTNASIEEIMNEAARWYGIEVVYRDKIDQQFGFVGIDRNMPISNLLRNLETIGGVHFEVDGKKVTVKK